MIQISTKSSVVTLINVFTVDPTHQQRLVELLTRATEVSVRHAPGFVAASLHRSIDGTKVTIYAQWRSVEDYQAMRQDPAPRPFPLHGCTKRPTHLRRRGRRVRPCVTRVYTAMLPFLVRPRRPVLW